jgi:type II secretory pathway component PulF
VPRDLTPEESAEVAFQVAAMAKAGLPLPAALEAVAGDVTLRRLGRVLRHLAQRLAAGAPLEQALAAEGSRLPAHFRGLLLAAVRSGRLAPMLDEFVDVTYRGQDLRRRVALSLIYPAALVALLALVLAAVFTVIVPQFSGLFRDFGMSLPGMTLLVISVPPLAAWIVAGVTAFLLVLLAATCAAPPGARWSRIASLVPLVGPLVRSNALARFCQLMAMLLDAGVPAAEALRLTAAGVPHAGLSAATRRAALAVEAGRPLDQALAAEPWFPPSMSGLVQWGRQTAGLGEALRSAGEMFEGRARDQGVLLQAVAPPLALLAFLALVGLIITALLLPLLALMTNLSGGPFGMNRTRAAEFLMLVNSLGVLLLGIGVLLAVWLVAGWAPHRRSVVEDLLGLVGRVLAALGIVMVCICINVGVLGLLIVGVVALVIWGRRRTVARQAMLRLLAVSAERSAPLGPAVEALARERRGGAAWRARRLARLLGEGRPLPEAVASVRGVLPPAAVPLVAVGSRTGSLPAALRQALASGGRQEALWQFFAPKAAYVCLLLPFALGVVTFFVVKIGPQFQKIYRDFGRELPPAARLVSSFAASWAGSLLLALAEPALFLVLVYVVLRYAGLIGWNLPGLGRLTRRLDTAAILDALALAADRQQPLLPAVETLAASYPRRAIRRRLAKVAAELAAGGDWSASLCRHGLVGQADQAILAAAARAGNLPWAMREVAEGNRRRFAYRTQAVLQVLFPAVVVAFGIVVLLVALSVFLPLIGLIQGLASL